MRSNHARTRMLPVTLAATLCLAAAGQAHAAPRAKGSSNPISELRPKHPGAPSASVVYYGGHIISHVQVVVVFWGSSVPSVATSNMGPFYTAITNSSFLDWMGEYDTATASAYDGMAGSNQHLYRGTMYKTVTITPKNTSGSITDNDIANELDAQISASVLPAPTVDAEGGVDTLYMVYFPSNVVISDPSGGTSCNSKYQSQNEFCGYHSGYQTVVGGKTVTVPFGVIPDLSYGGCLNGCGGTTELENFTLTSSHELAEALTDTEITMASSIGRPMGWYDQYNGEIGDICANMSGSATTVAGYTVQKEWSQRLGNCIGEDPSLPLCNGSVRPCRPCAASDDGGACNGTTPVCETNASSPKFGNCVACTSNTQCGSPTAPVCDATSDTCKGCSQDSQCGGATPKCDTGSGACVACNVSNDCTSPAASICDSSSHTCRGCKGSSDCSAPSVCDQGTGTCVGCHSDADCPNPNLNKCDVSSHTCVSGKPSGPGSDGGVGLPGDDAGSGDGNNGDTFTVRSGCSAAPSSPPGLAGLAALAAVAAALRRRRRA